MTLRPYQQRAVNQTVAFWRGGKSNPLIKLPTAAGKTRVIAALASYMATRGGRVLVMAHRAELVRQNADALTAALPSTVRVGVWAASLKRREVEQVTVASRDSIASHVRLLGRIDLVVIDEAHLVSTKEQTRYAKIISEVREGRPGAQVLGLTATPYRLDQGYLTQGEGALFSSLSCSVSERELLDDGYLTPVVTGDAHATIDTTALGVRAGEFVAADLELAADIDEVTQAVASDVRTALEVGRKSALVYGVSVSHCLHLQDALRAQGINAHLVTGETEPEFRRQILEDFKARKVQCIVSMDVLTTGFDAPVVDVVAIVRPTMSTSLYVQIVGRGMRLLDGAIGNLPTREERLEAIACSKPSCLLLDYGGNIARHGPIDEVRVKDKKAKKGEGEAPTKLCPTCYREQPAGVRECEACGYQFPPPEKRANKTASRLPVIGGFATRHDHPLITYREHRKDGRPPMLRVDYDRADGSRIASEFVDVEGRGWSGEQAWRWWSERVGGEPYATTEECLAHLHAHGARKVSYVETKPVTNSKWERVTNVKLG